MDGSRPYFPSSPWGYGDIGNTKSSGDCHCNSYQTAMLSPENPNGVGIENFRDALKEFDSFRKQLKKPLTDRAKSRLVNKLQTFPREDWVAILQKSIDKGWTDVYPIDNKPQKAAAKPINRGFTPTEF